MTSDPVSGIHPSQALKRVDSSSHMAVFIRYAERSKAFNVVDNEIHGGGVSRDATFAETAEWSLSFEICWSATIQILKNINLS